MSKLTVNIPDKIGRKRTYLYHRQKIGKKVKTYPFNEKGKRKAMEDKFSYDFLKLLAEGKTMFPDKEGFSATVSSILKKARINGTNISFRKEEKFG